MLKQTLSIVRHNPMFYGIFVVCSVGSQMLDEYSKKSSSKWALLFLSCLLVMNVQNSVLRNLNFAAAAKAGKLRLGGYMFRTLVLSLFVFLLALVPLLFFLGSTGSNKTHLVLWVMATFAVAFTLVLSLLGTWLPAYIYGARTTLGDALRRGFVRFPSTALLIFLSLVVSVVGGAAAVALATRYGGLFLISDGHLNIPTIAISLVSNVFQAISLSYIFVLLARRYMEAENIGSASQDLLAVFT